MLVPSVSFAKRTWMCPCILCKFCSFLNWRHAVGVKTDHLKVHVGGSLSLLIIAATVSSTAKTRGGAAQWSSPGLATKPGVNSQCLEGEEEREYFDLWKVPRLIQRASNSCSPPEDSTLSCRASKSQRQLSHPNQNPSFEENQVCMLLPSFEMKLSDWVWWCRLVVPALGLRQEDREFKDRVRHVWRLGNKRLCPPPHHLPPCPPSCTPKKGKKIVFSLQILFVLKPIMSLGSTQLFKK